MRKIAGIILILFSCKLGVSQKLSFSQYNIKDGLAGSTVYCITQDKEGFLWFGTETGLSRFDGTYFRNYTTLDGLPDNEILDIFADSKGRVWLASFKASVSYYYKGKIYNQGNDSVLNKIILPNTIVSIAEDNDGNILLMGQQFLVKIFSNGKVVSIKTFPSEKIPSYSSIGKRKEGGFWVLEKDEISVLTDSVLNSKKSMILNTHFATSHIFNDYIVSRSGVKLRMEVRSIYTDSVIDYGAIKGVQKVNHIDSNTAAVNTKSGSFVFNTSSNNSIVRFLPNETTSFCFKDNEKNLWIATLGNGVFKLNSEKILTIPMEEWGSRYGGVTSITGYKDSIFCGTDLNSIQRFKVGKEDRVFRSRDSLVIDRDFSIIKDLVKVSSGGIVYGSGYILTRLDKWGKMSDTILGISPKKFQLLNDSLLTVASSAGVMNLHIYDFTKRDTIWRDRATTVFVNNGVYYIGTLYGLWSIDAGRKPVNLGSKNQVLNGRISALAMDAYGVLWIGTYGNGVVGYKNGQVVQSITTENGLSSNLCKSLFVNNGKLWIGTDNGLNKLDVTDYKAPIIKYFMADGLISDNINSIYAKDSVIYIGTPAGLTYFKEADLSVYSDCLLRWTGMMVGGKSIEADLSYVQIPATDNSLRFDYVGISFRSNGLVTYRYRLIGLDSNWQTTKATYLLYPSLPYGDYTLQIEAVNKYGVKSNVLTKEFSVDKLYYQTIWFKVISAVFVISLFFITSVILVRRIKRREESRNLIAKKMTELEQLALKSQMNPHFIFNSLNSIQQYVMDKDVAGANKFISGFSRLIRQTLDFSSKQKIGLQEELDYLTNYLELEKTRLEGAFEYSIDYDSTIINGGYTLPPLILQPFVENSVRHGVRYRKDEKGHISIKVTIDQDHIYFLLEDNGIGRIQSLNLKSAMPIEYQSKGMSLTANRVELMNNNNKQKMRVTVEDAFPMDTEYPGTRIIVSIPTQFD